MASADRSRAKFDPDATAMAASTRSAMDDPSIAPPRFYNPSAANLVDADRKMASAFAHLAAAKKLDKFEDVACAGITVAERTSCPLIAPHLDKVEEGSKGIVLHLKSAEKAK